MGQDTNMLNTHQQWVGTTAERRPGLDPQLQSPETDPELLDIVLETTPAEQRSPGRSDSELQDQQQQSGSAGQATKDFVQKKQHDNAKAGDLLPPTPRKPSFPFQWAWESIALDGRVLLQPGSPGASSHHTERAQSTQGLPLSLVKPQSQFQPKSRHKCTVTLPEDQGSCWKSIVPVLEGRGQETKASEEGHWALEHPGQGDPQDPWLPGKVWDPESEEAAQFEALSEEEAIWGPRPGELGQRLVWEQEAEEAKEGEHRTPHGRRARPRRKGQNSGEENLDKSDPQGDNLGHSPRPRDQLGAQRGKPRPKGPGGPEGPWDLAKLQQQLKQELEGQGLCGPQKQSCKVVQDTVQASGRGGKAVREDKTVLSSSFSNRTFHKRQEATRSLLASWERQQQEEQQRAELRQAREQRMQQQVARCLATYTPRGTGGPAAAQRKLEELRRQERQRFVEYQVELRAMQHRVQARPYLFQQVMQTNARLTATRRFSEVLSVMGLNEEQLLAKGSRGNTEGTSRKAR
ncbi:PREDICTED: testis-specific protein 10-interacting protein [Elephantulus edwardii]|uniref:testis-specific protein 10-interacting protein n=1 Tax=Elephantulus edwardii TaxID=28737 RepID=UPI0003F0C9EE|nr:PREDICTED: testis-specific protein 10-interacting protein [Elephantulus edwardii]